MIINIENENWNASIERIYINTSPVLCIEAVFKLVKNNNIIYKGITLYNNDAISYMNNMNLNSLYQELLNSFNIEEEANINVENELNGN